MRAWLDGLLAILLAPACVSCSRTLPSPTRGCVCEHCWRRLDRLVPPLCARCGEPAVPGPAALHACAHDRGHFRALSAVRAVGPHDGVLRDLVHALKYDGRRSLARPLGALMREAAEPLVQASQACVPVPLHPSRRRERGFNQAADLARHLGLPVVHALRRTRRTETQTSLPAPDRHANVTGAFAVTRRAAVLRGSQVLLVDDVRTTGATLEACAQALREAGVGEVCAVTAARAALPRA